VRVLAVSDLHYRLPAYDWLVEAAGAADLVAIAGDLLDIVAAVPHEAQAVVVGAYLQRLADRTTVAACSGNHDLDGPGALGEQVAGWLAGQRVAGRPGGTGRRRARRSSSSCGPPQLSARNAGSGSTTHRPRAAGCASTDDGRSRMRTSPAGSPS
jgi:3',5'-cyclic AMP phosphodiesterase CpdA